MVIRSSQLGGVGSCHGKKRLKMDFNGDLMDVNGDLMDFNGDLMGFDWDTLW